MCMGSGDAFNGFGSNIPGCSYNTPFNTMGVGDMVPAGVHTLGNDFRQNLPKRSRKSITNISMKRPAQIPFVTPGSNDGFSSMGERPLFVPSGRPSSKR